jgi:hypothetical protein
MKSELMPLEEKQIEETLFSPNWQVDIETKIELVETILEDQRPSIVFRGKVINSEAKPFIYMIDQVLKYFAPIVLICGKQRMGKSSYGLTILDLLYYVFRKKYLQSKDITNFVHFNAREFIEQTLTATRSVIIIDEASKDLSKSDWFSLINQVLAKIIETQGDLNNIYIIILPHASRLAPQYKIYIDLKIVMKRRGEAKIWFMKKDHGELSGDIKKVSRAIFWGIWKLPKPPIDLWNAYEKLSEERKRAIGKEELELLRAKEKDWYCKVCSELNASQNVYCVKCGGRKGS